MRVLLSVIAAALLLSAPGAEPEQDKAAAGDIFFPSRPPRLMPYLHGLLLPDSSADAPARDADALTLSAHALKQGLARIGWHHESSLRLGGAMLRPDPPEQRSRFVSTDNSVLAKWFLLKDTRERHGLFLSCEADWGQGFHFSERRESVRHSLGALSQPQDSLRGGKGLFLPELALGTTLCSGRYLAMVGSLNAANYLDRNRYAPYRNGNLLNSSLRTNPCLPLLWGNWGYLTAWQPNKHLYTLYATTGSNGRINHNPLRCINSRYWVHIGEFGYIYTELPGLGPGIARLQYVATRHAGSSGHGVALNLEQQIGHRSGTGIFIRSGINDRDAAAASRTRAALTVGASFPAQQLCTDNTRTATAGNRLAAGFLWQSATANEESATYRHEYGVELSAFWQLTPTLYLQPDLQYIVHPARNAGRKGAWVWQLQAVLRF